MTIRQLYALWHKRSALLDVKYCSDSSSYNLFTTDQLIKFETLTLALRIDLSFSEGREGVLGELLAIIF